MIRPILYIVLFCFISFSFGRHDGIKAPPDESRIILTGATIVINGKTNVNKFNCVLTLPSISDTISIRSELRNQEIILDGLRVKFPVENFDCGIKMMNKDFREILQHEKHPYIEMIIEKIRFNDQLLPNITCEVQSEILLNIGGETRKETIAKGVLNSEGACVDLRGQQEIKMTAYGIEPPTKFLGTVKVSEDLNIDFELNLEVTQS